MRVDFFSTLPSLYGDLFSRSKLFVEYLATYSVRGPPCGVLTLYADTINDTLYLAYWTIPVPFPILYILVPLRWPILYKKISLVKYSVQLMPGVTYRYKLIPVDSLFLSSILQPLSEYIFSESTCPWCIGYRRRIWTRRHEFKSWTWLIAFHIALIPLGKVWIQLFSLQLWVNSRTD